MNHSIPNQVTGEFQVPSHPVSISWLVWPPSIMVPSLSRSPLNSIQDLLQNIFRGELFLKIKTDFQNFLGELRTRHPTFKNVPKHSAAKKKKEKKPIFQKSAVTVTLLIKCEPLTCTSGNLTLQHYSPSEVYLNRHEHEF